jgi:hypothetical protein
MVIVSFVARRVEFGLFLLAYQGYVGSLYVGHVSTGSWSRVCCVLVNYSLCWVDWTVSSWCEAVIFALLAVVVRRRFRVVWAPSGLTLIFHSLLTFALRLFAARLVVVGSQSFVDSRAQWR